MSLEHSTQRTARYLRASAAAKYIGLSPSTLSKMRVRGDSPPYSKAGPRIVVYDVADIEAWLPHVRPGGILCGHDYNFAGVMKAVKEFGHDASIGAVWYKRIRA